MSYIKQTWVDQDVERPKTYEVTNNQDGTITLTDSFGVVTEIGTPVNAPNMNHIEEGIENNDNAITTINGLIPSYATSSNKLTAMSDLDNIEALKGYLDSGKLLSDPQLFASVYYYNHSTFDVSKFTVTGSPTITDDGVVLTADSSNYAQLNFDFSQDHTFEIEIKGNNSSLSGAIRPFNYGYQVYINPNNSNRCLLYVNSGASYQIATITDEALKSNYTLKIRIKKVGLTYTIDYVINGTITGTLTTTLATTPTYETYIRFMGSLDEQHSADLKTLAIWDANGYPIFSGNKTGIDTIKPADYTIVGTGLTITDDGIASGFSASDYITKTTAITLDKTTYFEFDVTFTTPSSWTKNGRFWAYGNKQNFGHTSGGVISGGFIGTSINQTGLSALATNTKYNAKYIYDENGFYVAYKKANETTWTSSTPSAVTSNDTQTLQGAIGNAFTDTSAYYTGSIDLNSIKFYVNGNLVYQACLLIPYNESSTGSKIVDVAYRDRVIDVYNQFGSALYYTIDETNQNATLPMGEIYGFIEQVDEKIPSVKGYLDNGILLKNKELFKDVYYYNHSTFDISKFTKVGNPLITNDGIASGFSSGNYISISTGINVTNTNFEIDIPFIKTADSTVIASTTISNSGNQSFALIHANGHLMLYLGTSSSWDIVSGGTGTIKCQNNTQYIAKLIRTSSQYIVKLLNTKTRVETIEITVNSTTDLGNISTLYLGTPSFWANVAYNTIYDLKQFSITVDGKPVFNGNKTNVDVVKPDSYDNNGATISNDGIASGLSNQYHIDIDFDDYAIDITQPFRIETVVNIPSSVSNGVVWALKPFSGTSSAASDFNITSAQKGLYRLAVGSTITVAKNLEVQAGTGIYKFILEWSGSVYTLQAIDMASGRITGTDTYTSSSAIYNASHIDNLEFGRSNGNDGYSGFTGTVDLNGFKIYINNNLEYQACLRIPYTLSTTGAKIVDSVYRDRVIDVYKQFGSADYYTIDENNKNVTLPMGEIYGLMNKSASNLLPDWDRAISKTPYTTYTATERGWLNVIGYTNQDPIGVKINGNIVAFAKAPGSNDSTGFGCLVPIDVGDKYIAYTDRTGGASGSVYIDSIKFIPCKGDI